MVTPRANIVLFWIAASLLFHSVALAQETVWLTLKGALTVYEDPLLSEAALSLTTGTSIQIVQRYDMQWVELKYRLNEGREGVGFARVADLRASHRQALEIPAERPAIKTNKKTLRATYQKWGIGVGGLAGFQYQMEQTLSEPPFDGPVTGFQGQETGGLFYLDIPFVRWGQWRLEYLNHSHEMEATSLSSSLDPTVKFIRKKNFTSYHGQLKSYSFDDKSLWHGPGLMYMSASSATVNTIQGGATDTATFGARELAAAWVITYSVGKEWTVFQYGIFHPQIRGSVQFTQPFTLGIHALILGGFTF